MAAKVLLLEGFNRTGKTTVAGMLERKGFCYFKDNTFYSIKDTDNSFKSYILEKNLSVAENLIDNLPGITNIILDRHHITNYAFSFLRNEEKEKAEKLRRRKDDALTQRGAVLIMMTDSLDAILARNPNSDRQLVAEVLHRMNIGFFESNMPKYKLALHDPEFEDKLNEIIVQHFGFSI